MPFMTYTSPLTIFGVQGQDGQKHHVYDHQITATLLMMDAISEGKRDWEPNLAPIWGEVYDMMVKLPTRRSNHSLMSIPVVSPDQFRIMEGLIDIALDYLRWKHNRPKLGWFGHEASVYGAEGMY